VSLLAHIHIWGGQGTIKGSLYQDPTASFSGVSVLGSINSSNCMGTYLSQLGQTVMNTATTAQGLEWR
jgi:hypothetical protein